MQTHNREQIKVLFVDDDDEFLKSAKQYLQIHGNFDIESASSADEALKKMKKRKLLQ